MAETNKIEAVFEFERETRRTYRYREIESYQIGTIYLQKHLFSEKPKRIKVTVEILGEEEE